MPIVFQISLKKLALKGLFLPERDLSKLFNGFHYNFQTFFFADQLWFCIFPFGYFKKSDWRSLVRHYTEFVSSKKVNILLFGGAGNSRSLIKREISKSSTTRVPAEECPHVILLSIIVCMC